MTTFVNNKHNNQSSETHKPTFCGPVTAPKFKRDFVPLYASLVKEGQRGPLFQRFRSIPPSHVLPVSHNAYLTYRSMSLDHPLLFALVACLILHHFLFSNVSSYFAFPLCRGPAKELLAFGRPARGSYLLT